MASATKAAQVTGMSPVRVYVGSHVDTATKAVERGEGSPGNSVWDLIELAAEELDEDAGEVFALLYEPEGLDE